MIIDLWDKLKKTSKPIVLYGMGNGADKIIAQLTLRGIPFKGIFATDGFVRPKIFHGLELTSYSASKEKFGDMVVLLCFGSSRPEVVANIKLIASEQELYAPDVPVYGDTVFDLDYARKNADSLKRVYDRLADSFSRHTFKNIVLYKISGDINYLFDCEISPDEPYSEFFHLRDDEVYLDLGAYRGDTVMDFNQRVCGYDGIIAVEPDPKTYEKLCSAIEDMPNTQAVNACITDHSGQCLFGSYGSRGSSVSGGGSVLRCETIDSLLSGRRTTLIKMDIEGEETAAILGATNTILKFKPKMQISCYHRSEDLITIPTSVLNIRDDYQMYIRHFPGLPCWDTSFYFV